MPTIRTYEVVISFEVYRPDKELNLGWEKPGEAVTCKTVEALHHNVNYFVTGRIENVHVDYPMLFDDPKIVARYTIISESIDGTIARTLTLKQEVNDVIRDMHEERHNVQLGVSHVNTPSRRCLLYTSPSPRDS